ncbi:hypothetical protein pEaSNUABM54_00017 [Erwinia phage pEa_SNUABM_54]|nr:hypothetical protein pEaSNUABM54_00017 [Erwinia phage pEa_SNUABM_54]
MSITVMRRGLDALLASPPESVVSIIYPDQAAVHVRAKPIYKNNYTVENGLIDRFLRVLDFVKVEDVAVQDIRGEGRPGQHIQFMVTDYSKVEPLQLALDQFGVLSKYVPDNLHGNQLLAALLSKGDDDAAIKLRWLRKTGYSVFQEHPLTLAQGERLNSVVWNDTETMVYDSDLYGEIRYPSSIRIPLKRGDGCPFYDIALMGILFTEGPSEAAVDWRFAFRMTQESPWSLLSSTKTGESSVRNQVLKYSRRKWVCENSKRPFTDKGEWPYLP